MLHMKKLIGSKAFYKRMALVLIPIILQNGITNFVSLLDNIMVGRIGTEQMSGVAIVNQLLFVFNLAIFGAISGAGIFGAQFYGKDDHKGVRHAFRYKLYICGIIVVLGLIVLISFGDQLILLFLHGEATGGRLDAALAYGKDYLKVMLFGLLPFAVVQSYAGTLRECGETVVPMKAGVIAVFVNLVLNYLLIFGKLGFPCLGVVGAALATMISRYVELAIVVIWTHTNSYRMPFIVGAFKGIGLPRKLTKDITFKSIPLMMNEVLWAAGMSYLVQCYSLRGLDAVAGINISSTITNLFNIVFMAMGNAVAIMVGQQLGAGKLEEARDTDTKLIAFSVMSCFVMGTLLFLAAPLFPRLYNTTSQVKQLATSFIRVVAVCMPVNAFCHAAYFTLRAGGKTLITFIFDCVFLWGITVPLAHVLSRYTALPSVPLFLLCEYTSIFKCVFGFIMVKKGVWIRNIVAEQE